MFKLQPEALAAICARLADERKADDIVVLHVTPLTTIADYFVIATGRNVRQLRAIANRIHEGVHALGLDFLQFFPPVGEKFAVFFCQVRPSLLITEYNTTGY